VYFSWLIPFALVLVADQNPYGLHNISVSPTWHTRVRVLGALGGMVQSLVPLAIAWALATVDKTRHE